MQSTPTGAADAETIWLRRASQSNDRQVLPAPMIAHIKANGSATVAGDRCVRLVSRMLTRRQHIMIDLIRRLAIERRVRARLIEPFLKKREFPVERFTAKWHEDPARTFVLEAQDESFNECDTPVLANSTEAGCDPVVITPIFEHAAPELLAHVADDVFRGGTGGVNGTFEEVRNRYGCGIVPEGFNAHHAPRVVVDDHRHPPTKRPALG